MSDHIEAPEGAVVCETCKGKGTVWPLGAMLRQCPTCKGIGSPIALLNGHGPKPEGLPPNSTKCTLCAAVHSPGFYTGCLLNDGHDPDNKWSCDGKGNLTLKSSFPKPEEADKAGETPKRVWVAISNTNGCPLMVEDTDHSANNWPGAKWIPFVEETALAESRAEVEKYASELQSLCDTIMGAPNVATRFSDVRQRLLEDLSELTALREEVTRLREWLPIETAPKDESVFLWHRLAGREIGWFCTVNKCWRMDGGETLLPNPTHWRPLPAAPKEGGTDG